MKKYLLGMLSLAVAVGFVGCSNPNEVTKEELSTIKLVKGSELKSVFEGNTLVGMSYKWGKGFALTYNADGSFSGTVADGAKKLAGKWYIKGDEKCQTYSNGKIGCTEVYKKGDVYYSVKDMTKTSEFKIQ